MSPVHLRVALCSLISLSIAAVPAADVAAAEPAAADPEPTEPTPTEPSGGEGDARTDPPSAEDPVANTGMKDPVVEARLAYERGRDLYDQGRYEEALGAFLDAQRLFASPDHHHNIGRCYEALGRNELAIEYYRAYLRSDPPDRANIQNKIDRLERLSKIEAAASSPGETSPSEPDAGPAATEPAPEPSPKTDEPTPGRPLVISGAVLIGAGSLLALGGGIGFGVAAGRRSDEVRDVFESDNPQGLTREETRSADASGRRLETAQIVTAALGGAVAVTGAVLLVLGVRKNRAASSKPSVSVFGGRRSAGLTVGGRF